MQSFRDEEEESRWELLETEARSPEAPGGGSNSPRWKQTQRQEKMRSRLVMVLQREVMRRLQPASDLVSGNETVNTSSASGGTRTEQLPAAERSAPGNAIKV